MKRYILFSWNNYEAEGGAQDLVDSFDTFDDLVIFVNENFKTKLKERINLLDIKTGIVYVCTEIPFKKREFSNEIDYPFILK